MDYSERLMRAAIRAIPDGVYQRHHAHRRLPRRSRALAPRSADRRHDHGQGRRDARRSRGHRAAGAGSPDQHAVRGHGRLRDLADAALDPARQRRLRADPAEQRTDAADQDRRAQGLPRQPDLPGARDRPLLPGQRARRRRDEGARARRARRRSAPASAISPSSPSAGRANDQQWVHMEILEGSYGGRNGIDGMDTVDTLYANTRNNPIEDIEFASAAAGSAATNLREDVVARRAMARRHRFGARIYSI